MVRSVCCVVVLLTAGLARSAPPTERADPSHPPRIRFLSLAEARAIALDKLFNPSADIPSNLPVTLADEMERRLRADIHSKSRDELERGLNQKLLNVEVAYWNLYGSYWQLHSREQALRFACETRKIVEARYKVGRVSLADVAQAEGQYELFRSQRLQALDTVLDNERQLWAMLGLPIGDGVRLVPSDAPTTMEKKPDWDKALPECLNRPELRLARQDVKAAQLNLFVTKNIVLPVLRFVHIEGNDPSRLGQAQLKPCRAFLTLQDQELKAERFLGLYYRRMSSSLAQIKAARAQREAFATQLRVRSEKYRAGAQDASLDLMLESQRFWADALATECQAVVSYNNSLAGWEYAKGTILTYAHIALAEQPPSGDETSRAAAHEHKRTRTQVRREPAAPADSVLCVSAPASLPALWKSFPPLLDADEAPAIQTVSTDKASHMDACLIEWKASDIFPKKKGYTK